jgi:hypothetical protein
MIKQKAVWWVTVCACACPGLAGRSESIPAAGLYQIVSGTYIACCGIAGEIRSDLPSQSQSFVRLTFSAQNDLPTLTFLDSQMKTIFSVTPCPPGDPISFSFGYGLVLSDRIVFHVDPGPPPYSEYWNYTVSNSLHCLRIDGVLGISPGACSDVPNQFTHSNIVAVLVPEPKLAITDISKEGPLLLIQGQAGQTNVIEASSDLRAWIPLSTNVMPNTTCPACPFISFRDNSATNVPTRFYRTLILP